MGSTVLKFLFGLFMIFSGTGFIGNPDMGLTTITLAMAIYLLADGLIASVYSFTLLSIGKGKFILASGVLTVIFAVLVYTTWPQSGLYILGMFISAKLVVDGIAFYLTGDMISKASA